MWEACWPGCDKQIAFPRFECEYSMFEIFSVNLLKQKTPSPSSGAREKGFSFLLTCAPTFPPYFSEPQCYSPPNQLCLQ